VTLVEQKPECVRPLRRGQHGRHRRRWRTDDGTHFETFSHTSQENWETRRPRPNLLICSTNFIVLQKRLSKITVTATSHFDLCHIGLEYSQYPFPTGYSIESHSTSSILFSFLH
jgi:hypothetical protein